MQRNRFFFEKLMHVFTVNAIKAKKASKPNIPALPKIEKKNEWVEKVASESTSELTTNKVELKFP